MSFCSNLSKINKLVFLFGIAPYLFDSKTNKFKCSIPSLTYTFAYFLFSSITIIYQTYDHHSNNGIAKIFETTLSILSFIQFTTVMIMFYGALINLIVNRRKHARFLNSLVELDSNLAKIIINNSHVDLSTLHKQHVLLVLLYVLFCIVDSLINRHRWMPTDHLWNFVQLLQTATLTLLGFYIRCLAIITDVSERWNLLTLYEMIC